MAPELSAEAIIDRQDDPHSMTFAAEADEFPGQCCTSGVVARTFLGTPLLREGTAIGVIFIRRTEVKSFHREADSAA